MNGYKSGTAHTEDGAKKKVKRFSLLYQNKMSLLKPAVLFRDFLAVLKNDDDLVEITSEIDPHLEAGAIMRKVYEHKLPVPYFRNLKKKSENPDPENLFDMVGCIAGLRDGAKGDHARVAHHLGLDPNTPMKQIIDYLVECYDKTPIPPQLVEREEAPFSKHELSGDAIDLFSLPAPFLHPEDGGLYIQTYGMFILQTPDKSWTNWSIARAMIYDKNHLTGIVMNPQHIQQVSAKWKEAGYGSKIPYVLAFGVPPAAILASSMPIPDGVSEGDYVGALIGEPLQVVKAKTVDLEVPRDSEMVFEGYLDIEENLVKEGPFGEMHGYVFPGTGHPCPSYTVQHINYRDHAILPVSNPGICTDETHTFIGGLTSASCKQIALQHEILSKIVLDVFTPYESQALWLVLKIDTKVLPTLKLTKKQLADLVKEVFYFSKPARIIHEIVLVGDDIDIFDFKKVIWAYVTRHTPGDDIFLYEDVPSFPLAPFIGMGPRMKTKKGGKAVTVCLFDQQFVDPDFPFVGCYYESYGELCNSIDEKFASLGYK